MNNDQLHARVIAQTFDKAMAAGVHPIQSKYIFEEYLPRARQLIAESAATVEERPTHSGSWMTTLTGRFDPLHPIVSEVSEVDIAHALAMQCRYGGHVIEFYSVAEHCVHLCDFLRDKGHGPAVQMWALMHDASEAYLCDIVRPVKRQLPEYARIERVVMAAVQARFCLGPIPDVIASVDNRIVIDERRQNMHDQTTPWSYGGETLPLGIHLQYWTPPIAKRKFLDRFYDLQEKLT